MRGKGLSSGLRALAIVAVTLLVTSTWAATNWNEKVLHSFNGTDGNYPYAGLVFDAAGNLYGTTENGGTYTYGMVFELTPTAGGGWTEQVLHNFNHNGTDGVYPNAGLIFDAAGNLYGTTQGGGAYGPGTVFELTPTKGGGWTEQVLYSFCSQTNCTDGETPFASLIFDAAGNLYSTTLYGGAYGGGTVFELTPTGSGGWTETVLHSFNQNGTDGAGPLAGLIFDAAGNLYGTTSSGGSDEYGGTVFELAPSGGGWTETVLYSFCSPPYCTDGFDPVGGVIFDTVGNLYGTTFEGGALGFGTVFELTRTAGGGWTETLLYSFCVSYLNCTDGANPQAGLIFDAAGNLYGTTRAGGIYNPNNCTLGCGTVFELRPNGIETVLHSFNDNGIDGVVPDASLIFDAYGNLYSTTVAGGTYGDGTVFELTPLYPCARCSHAALQ